MAISSEQAFANWKKNRQKLITRGVGRQRLYENTEELLNAFEDYIEDCLKTKTMPTIAGYTVAVFQSQTTRAKYEKDPDFAEACQECRMIIEDLTINSGKVDGSIRKLVLQSRFDYAEKQEQIVAQANLSAEELERYKKELEEDHGITFE